MAYPVLVLNQNYEPLNVCNARRAFTLLDQGKAEVIEHNGAVWHSAIAAFTLPSVIRLVYLVRRPRPRLRFSRREVFIRDRFVCQYCGQPTRDLTIDHVVPRHRGGEHIWENVVSACKACNHRKAGKTLVETRLRLLRPPVRPPNTTYYIFYSYLETQLEWRKFIPVWEWERAGLPVSAL